MKIMLAYCAGGGMWTGWGKGGEGKSNKAITAGGCTKDGVSRIFDAQ